MKYEYEKLRDGDTYTFTAMFEQVSFLQFRNSKNKKVGRTPQLQVSNVKLDDTLILPEAYINYTATFKNLGELLQGDSIRFSAKIKTRYGFLSNSYLSTTYKFQRATKAKLLNKPIFQRNPMPKDNNELVGYATLCTLNSYIQGENKLDDYYINLFDKWVNKSNYSYLTNSQLEADWNAKQANSINASVLVG